MNNFEDLVEECYQRFLLHGKEEMMTWLHKELKKQDAQDAMKEFILRSLEKAEEILLSGEDLTEYQEDYQTKKSKKGVH